MKKFNLYLLFLLGVIFVACENLPDEQFVKRVVFAENGFQDIDLVYNESGKVTPEFTVSISGTSVLQNDVNVTVKLAADTLDAYNVEKYRKDSILYYSLLPDSCYTISNNGNITINAGEESTVLPVEFDLSKIDKYKDYVLPLAIVYASDYEVGEPQYSKVLLHLNISNSFSGIYQPTDCKIFEGDENVAWKTNFVLKAIDNNTCRFYAGGISETNKKRDTYIIEVSKQDDGKITYVAHNPEIGLTLEDPNKNTIEVTITRDPAIHSKKTVVTSMKMNYSYTDISDPTNPIRRRFEGMLSNTQVIYDK